MTTGRDWTAQDIAREVYSRIADLVLLAVAGLHVGWTPGGSIGLGPAMEVLGRRLDPLTVTFRSMLALAPETDALLSERCAAPLDERQAHVWIAFLSGGRVEAGNSTDDRSVGRGVVGAGADLAAVELLDVIVRASTAGGSRPDPHDLWSVFELLSARTRFDLDPRTVFRMWQVSKLPAHVGRDSQLSTRDQDHIRGIVDEIERGLP